MTVSGTKCVECLHPSHGTDCGNLSWGTRCHCAFTRPDRLVIKVNDNVTMSPKKMAAQAVHAALLLYGIDHGPVVVLGGRPGQIRRMPVQVHDAGWTELKPGTLTAGAEFDG